MRSKGRATEERRNKAVCYRPDTRHTSPPMYIVASTYATGGTTIKSGFIEGRDVARSRIWLEKMWGSRAHEVRCIRLRSCLPSQHPLARSDIREGRHAFKIASYNLCRHTSSFNSSVRSFVAPSQSNRSICIVRSHGEDLWMLFERSLTSLGTQNPAQRTKGCHHPRMVPQDSASPQHQRSREDAAASRGHQRHARQGLSPGARRRQQDSS